MVQDISTLYIIPLHAGSGSGAFSLKYVSTHINRANGKSNGGGRLVIRR